MHYTQNSPADRASNNKQKQTQAMATPLSKHYAAPKFHHSPAPASLPPPPFLSKPLPQRDISSFSNHTTAPIDGSPLGFLFSAKEREDSLSKLRNESPPVMSFTHDAQPGASISIHDLFSSAAAQRSSTPTIIEQATPEVVVKPKAAWAPIERPQVVPLYDMTTTTTTTPPPRKVHHRKTQSSPVLENIMQPKRSAFEKKEFKGEQRRSFERKGNDSESRTSLDKKDNKNPERPKSKGKGAVQDSKKPRKTKTSAPPASLTPKSILKREAQPETTHRVDSSPLPVSRSKASAFTPLKPRATESPRSHAFPESSEDDLRRQAVQLMDLLKLQSTPSRESSPVIVKEEIENDLRRLLRLSA